MRYSGRQLSKLVVEFSLKQDVLDARLESESEDIYQSQDNYFQKSGNF